MRVNGNFNFPINFEPTGQMILDARLTVPTRADLTTAYTEKNNYYPKMVVTVEDENALYMLTGSNPAQAGNWTRLDAGAITEVSVENVLTSTSTTNALSAAMGKKLNDEKVAKTTTVNGKPLSANVVITGDDINVEAPAEYGGSTVTLQGIIDSIGAASDDYVTKSQMGVANGVASLDSSGRVPSAQLPSYVDDVLEYNNRSSFPGTGLSGIIYIAKDTNLIYRWTGGTYVEISPSLALGETSSTAYAGNKGKANADNIDKINSIIGDGVVHSMEISVDPEDKYSALEYVTIAYRKHDSTHTDLSDNIQYIRIPKADSSSEHPKAGVMSYTDKQNLDNVVSALTWKEIE